VLFISDVPVTNKPVRNQQDRRIDAERVAVRVRLVEELLFRRGQRINAQRGRRAAGIVVVARREERGVVQELSPENVVEFDLGPTAQAARNLSQRGGGHR
jgi:hypothetical protein